MPLDPNVNQQPWRNPSWALPEGTWFRIQPWGPAQVVTFKGHLIYFVYNRGTRKGYFRVVRLRGSPDGYPNRMICDEEVGGALGRREYALDEVYHVLVRIVDGHEPHCAYGHAGVYNGWAQIPMWLLTPEVSS